MDFSTMAGLSRRMIHPENRSPLFRIMRLAKSRFLSRLSLLLSMTAAELRASSAVALMAALSQISFDQTFSATLKFYGSDRDATDHLRLDIFSNAGRPKRLPSAFSITIA
jgi:hypothetical protein